jgi:hypothetical protein
MDFSQYPEWRYFLFLRYHPIKFWSCQKNQNFGPTHKIILNCLFFAIDQLLFYVFGLPCACFLY